MFVGLLGVNVGDGTSKSDFEALAVARLREARALLAAGEFDGARYLAGYCVECALKAVITKAIVAQTLPRKRSIDKAHTHNLADLLDLAGKRPALLGASEEVRASWTTVISWTEQLRYETGADRSLAEDLLVAIDDPSTGVLPWLKTHW